MADMESGLAGAGAGAGAVAARRPDGGPSGDGGAGGDPWTVTGLVRQRPRHLRESNVSWPVDQRIAGSVDHGSNRGGSPRFLGTPHQIFSNFSSN